MRSFRLQTLLFITCIISLPAIAQDPGVVRIGVSPLHTGTDKVSANEARDRLVKVLNRQKPDKKGKVSIQAVALDSFEATQAMAEAKEKSCQFLLHSRLTDLDLAEQLDAAQNIYVPGAKAKVSYHLESVLEHTELARGSAVSEMQSSPSEAVHDAMGRVANEVVTFLKNAVFSSASDRPPLNQQARTKPIEVQFFSPDYCKWLPGDRPHSQAIRGVCEYAMSLPRKMPNFICDQQTSRFRGQNSVPRDLITASVRYEDGNESYSEIKLNGQPAPAAITGSPGLWSTGEFGSNLRAVFDVRNQPVFEFAGENTLAGRAAWLFHYHIVKQNDPLWRLRSEDDMVAPPYDGELWIDAQSGDLLRFRAIAKDIPADFPTQHAELLTDYGSVSFGDGSAFLLPVEATVATQFRAEELTRNVLQFRNCHKFRARTHMLLNVPGSAATADGVDRPTEHSADESDNENIYAILREQAVREDESEIEIEQRPVIDTATLSALSKLASLERDRKRYELAHRATLTPVAPLVASKPETTLKVSVRLVPVTVVLRDPKGEAVGNLRKEDFELLDNGKPQPISSFTMEHSAKPTSQPVVSGRPDQAVPVPSAPPDRSIAYIFDDVHAPFAELVDSRQAAQRHLAALGAQGRAALFTTSGQVQVAFTNDTQALKKGLDALRPHPLTNGVTCPPISPYMADLIINHSDLDALKLATVDADQCAYGGAHDYQQAEKVARATAFEVLNASSAENQSTISVLRYVFGKVGAEPGNRSIVFVSPGFLNLAPEMRQGINELIDAALRAGIIVSSIDVRGLHAPVNSPEGSHSSDPILRDRYDREETASRTDLLADLAYSTGGTFFHNSNDLDQGFLRTTEAPEYRYILGFSPQKLDGKFHKLAVRLISPAKVTIQVRQGYFAMKPAENR